MLQANAIRGAAGPSPQPSPRRGEGEKAQAPRGPSPRRGEGARRADEGGRRSHGTCFKPTQFEAPLAPHPNPLPVGARARRRRRRAGLLPAGEKVPEGRMRAAAAATAHASSQRNSRRRWPLTPTLSPVGRGREGAGAARFLAIPERRNASCGGGKGG